MADIPIPFPHNLVGTVAMLRDRLPAVVWLDGEAGGRYSIIAAGPREQLVSDSTGTWGFDKGLGAGRYLGADDPLALLQQRLDAGRNAAAAGPSALPFNGGAIGYFGYELGRRLQGQAVGASLGPELAVGLYDWALVVDHHDQCAWLGGLPPADVVEWLSEGQTLAPGAWAPRSAVTASPGLEGYSKAFERVMHYLREGDCYQINLTRRFQAAFTGDPLAIYADFRERTGGPFAGYLDIHGGPILSGSPERFLQVRNGVVETRPIKGTRARLSDPVADKAAQAALLSSPKDRAENTMIVDLLRNDLGRGCLTGSVQVPRLHALETFATVHHMVSVVTGRLKSDYSSTDLLRDALPGGSITGAPKLRAMEIIDELEAFPRGVYCGAIGYLGWDGSMDTNIAIRTMTARDGWLDYRAGGGVVIDSECQDEFNETESKAAAFRDLIAGVSTRIDSAKRAMV
ncbi:MAG: aminodeoxychorismate synthase component I [Spiribacter sp.]|nr:aminodeoxychorismate synthase component I [Spiribacter sp.]